MNPSQLQTVTLEKIKYACQQMISPHLAGNISLEILSDCISNNMIAMLRAEIAGEHLDRQTITYPLDWKEAVKERLYQWLGQGWDYGHWPWLGDYCRKRWPVLYRTVHIDVRALYPKISLPREQHSIVMSKWSERFTTSGWTSEQSRKGE